MGAAIAQWRRRLAEVIKGAPAIWQSFGEETPRESYVATAPFFHCVTGLLDFKFILIQHKTVVSIETNVASIA